MTQLSFVIMVFLGFVPPFSLAARMYEGSIPLPKIAGIAMPVPLVLILLWFVVWLLLKVIQFIVRLLVSEDMFTLWADRLIEANYPLLPTSAFPLASLLLCVIFVAEPFLSFSLYGKPELVTLAYLGVLAEIARRLEVAVRDEHLWMVHNKRAVP